MGKKYLKEIQNAAKIINCHKKPVCHYFGDNAEDSKKWNEQIFFSMQMYIFRAHIAKSDTCDRSFSKERCVSNVKKKTYKSWSRSLRCA